MPTWALRAGRQSPPSLQQSVNHQTHTQQILLTIVRALATRLKRQPVWLLVLVGWLLFRLPQRRLVASLLFQEPPRKTKAVFGQLSSIQIDRINSKMQCTCGFFNRLRRSPNTNRRESQRNRRESQGWRAQGFRALATRLKRQPVWLSV